MSVLVYETGAVLETRRVQSAGRDAGLDDAALGADRSARYEPETQEGVRVKMWTTLRIPFKL